MSNTAKNTLNSGFLKEVLDGLGEEPKRLPSKYFYDAKGDDLFVAITQSPEYYPTDAEKEILSEQSGAIIDAAKMNEKEAFELIELGAGDGHKTVYLLKELLDRGLNFTYRPIDISQNVLDQMSARLKKELPNLKIEPLQGQFFTILHEIKDENIPKLILFLGSTLGNMPDERAQRFLKALSDEMKPRDRFLIGLDRIKEEEVVLPAYNDAQGITAEFNLNLLRRINRELEGDFDIDQFEHKPTYSEEEGIARSYLVSKKDQWVKIGPQQEPYFFTKGEPILTEISRKYDRAGLERILRGSGLAIDAVFSDQRNYFNDYLLRLAY